MSFGFSVGDIFLAGQLAWSLYKSCKGAGGAFEELSREIISLHTVIREVQDEIDNPDSILNRSSKDKKKALGVLIQHCNGVLQQLNKILVKYKSLGTNNKRTWDRLRWGSENLSEIRDKIMLNTSSLAAFLTTLGTGSLGRIEKKLDQLIEDVRAGRREETVLTMAEDNEDEADIQWNLWKTELMEDGFSKVELETHKHVIKAKLAELVANGHLQEDGLPERPESPKAASSNEPTTEATSSKNLQPTVEDVDEDDDDGQTVLPQQRPTESVDASIVETAQDDHHGTGNLDTTDEESDSGDSDAFSDNETCLPEDSVSNVGLNVPDSHVSRPSSAPSEEQAKNGVLKERPRSSSGTGRESGSTPNDLGSTPLKTTAADGSTPLEEQDMGPQRSYLSPKPSDDFIAPGPSRRAETFTATYNVRHVAPQFSDNDEPRRSSARQESRRTSNAIPAPPRGKSNKGSRKSPPVHARVAPSPPPVPTTAQKPILQTHSSEPPDTAGDRRGRDGSRLKRAVAYSSAESDSDSPPAHARDAYIIEPPPVPTTARKPTLQTHSSKPPNSATSSDIRDKPSRSKMQDYPAKETIPPLPRANTFASDDRRDRGKSRLKKAVEYSSAESDSDSLPARPQRREPTRYIIDNGRSVPIPRYRSELRDLNEQRSDPWANEERVKSIQDARSELDRLRGQLSDYLRYGNTVLTDDIEYRRIPEQEAIIKRLEEEQSSADARDRSIGEGKRKLEHLRGKLATATRNDDFAVAADLQYYAIPEQEEYVKSLEKEKMIKDAASNLRPFTHPPSSTKPYVDNSSSGDGPQGFTFSNPESIFAEFLRQQGGGIDGPRGFEDRFGDTAPGRSTKPPKQDGKKEDELPSTIERPLRLTLEELFKGTHKKMKIKRKVFDEVTGKRIIQEKVLEMYVIPGLKKGSKIKFKGVGDQEEFGQQDLHFIIEEKPHPMFRRDRDDIHHALELTLRESLCGWKGQIQTIDGKTINIEKSNPTPPGSKDVYPSLGMPNSKRPEERGDFIVEYIVKYPPISQHQKEKLSELL